MFFRTLKANHIISYIPNFFDETLRLLSKKQPLYNPDATSL